MLEMIPMLNYFADLVYDGYDVNKKSQNHTSSCGKGWQDEQKTTHTILSFYCRHVQMYNIPNSWKKANVEPAFTFCAFLRYISKRL